MGSVGDLVAAGRAKARLTQKALAQKAGVSHPWIRALETDRMRKPNAAWLRRVATELGLDYRELLALTDQLGALEPESTEPGGGDLSAVVAAISSQTEVLRRIADHLEAQPSPAQENLRTIVALAVEGTLQVLVERGLLAAPPERDGAPAQQGHR